MGLFVTEEFTTHILLDVDNLINVNDVNDVGDVDDDDYNGKHKIMHIDIMG